MKATSVKVKFRTSTTEGKEGKVYYQVIHRRVARQIKTCYKLFPCEWVTQYPYVSIYNAGTGRREYLQTVKHRIAEDINILHNLITVLERTKNTYTADELVLSFHKTEKDFYLFEFMKSIIANMKSLNKHSIGENYISTLNSFSRFRNGADITLNELDQSIILEYESYLKASGVCPNTSSFYMRNLRAVYNRAVEKGIITQTFPFRHVYTGIGKTVKRAVTLNTIKRIKNMNLSAEPSLEYARDMFMFSFYTRGMSFIDMAYLKKTNLHDGTLTYRRKKTGQQLNIKWESCMQAITEKYGTENSKYMLPIISEHDKDERHQYKVACHLMNIKLKKIGKKLGLHIPLTMYVARHSWASVAKSKNIPVSIISEGMGHDSEKTTMIYLATLDTSAIDKANRMILRAL